MLVPGDPIIVILPSPKVLILLEVGDTAPPLLPVNVETPLVPEDALSRPDCEMIHLLLY